LSARSFAAGQRRSYNASRSAPEQRDAARPRDMIRHLRPTTITGRSNAAVNLAFLCAVACHVIQQQSADSSANPVKPNNGGGGSTNGCPRQRSRRYAASEPRNPQCRQRSEPAAGSDRTPARFRIGQHLWKQRRTRAAGLPLIAPALEKHHRRVNAIANKTNLLA